MTSFAETSRAACLKSCHPTVVNDASYYEPTNIYYTNAATTIYQSDTNNHHSGVTNSISNDEWGSVCSPESTGRECSPGTNNNNMTFMSSSPPSSTTFHQYSSGYYAISTDNDDQFYDDAIYPTPSTNIISPPTVVRVVKRRNTANKKERRRTQSINTAFSSLRNKIPNVPADTKLSKIKTLRLATSYISYLTRVLEGDQDPSSGFRAELVPSSRKINAERRAHFKNELQNMDITAGYDMRKCKGRTGWPQHVWASELKQE